MYACVCVTEGTLTISSVRPEQAGLYQCVGTNAIGVNHAVGRVDVTPRGAVVMTTPAMKKDGGRCHCACFFHAFNR